MSCHAIYIRLTDSEYQRLIENFNVVDEFFGYLSEENSKKAKIVSNEGRVYALLAFDWQALHYLLTNEVAVPGQSQLTSALSKIVMGGKVVEAEGYDEDIRYLTPEEVKEIASTLVSYDKETAYKIFKCREHQPVEIYHHKPPTEWDYDYLEFMLIIYDELREFFFTAAAEDNAILIYIG
jgi:Domain of unknown function (DUF1877)